MTGYHLGIDLGTTYSAAAVARDDRVQVVGLGNRSAAIPSVIYLREDETILTGEAAQRRAATEPERIARESKRRIGDPTPLLLGGSPYSAEALASKLLRWIVERVAELEGGPADQLAITHPANWGPYKQDLLRQAIRMADLPAAVTLTEPQAAAISYAANERVEVGSLIAVYDLGGGTFDAAVLRKTTDGFDLLGEPEGIERLGGIDFDEAVFAHVRRALGDALAGLDVDDPATIAALARLRQECVDTKEALSADTEASIPVLLPHLQTEVRLTRAEFEQLVRPPLAETVAAMRRALDSAETAPEDVSAVLLVGGSSRIPLVAELVSDAFGRPIAVDAHPKHAIALGAAHAAALEATRAPQAERADPALVPVAAAAPVGGETPVGDPTVSMPPLDTTGTAPAVPQVTLRQASGPAEPSHPPAPEPGTVAARSGDAAEPDRDTSDADAPVGGPRSRIPLLAGATAAILVIAGVAVWALGGDDADEGVLAAEPEVEAVDTDESEPAEVEDEVEPDEVEVAADDTHDDGTDGQHDGHDDAAGQEQAESQSDGVTGADAVEDASAQIPPDVDFATIDGITVDGSTYVVDFTTHRFEAELPGVHVHFFFDTVPPEQAGVPGNGPWFLYGGDSPFTGYGTGDRPSGAERMCVLVANPDHSVQADSGNCVDLP